MAVVRDVIAASILAGSRLQVPGSISTNTGVAPILKFDPVGKLVGGRIPQICVGMQAYYRDVYDHLLRVSNMIDARREMIVTAIQVNLGMISLAENEVTKRLGSFAALFAVPTMIAGIYGMNFEHMPELKWAFGYPFAILLMVISAVLPYLIFKRKGWL